MQKKTRVCVISPEIVGPHRNGGIGTHAYYFSIFLAQQLKQEVTFLYTGKIELRTESYWRQWFREQHGVEFAWIAPPKADLAVPSGFECSFIQTAREVYNFLRDRGFDACHFQEMLGNGFRCFQAKRLGLAFQQTVLTCTVHSSWEWICQAMQAFPQAGMEELQTKFMERYCIEHCDLLISPSDYMLQWLEQNQIKTPAPKFVLPYLFDPNLRPAGYEKPANHIIFFGRLEVRKGLLLFLEALRKVDQQHAFAQQPLQVTFLGKSGYTLDGGGSQSIAKYRAQLSNAIQITELTDFGHRQAMDFLAQHKDALVVCPSLVDNSPYAIIESLQLGVNIIAAKSGGIPELFEGTDRLFEPEPGALAAKIQAGLDNKLSAPVKRYSLERSSQVWREFCERTLPAHAQAQAKPEKPSGPVNPKLQVFFGCNPSAPGLANGFTALSEQSYQKFSVTVAPTGGAGESSLPSEALQYCHKQGWTVLNTEQLTTKWPPPSTPIAVFLSAGCIPDKRLLEQAVRVMANSEFDALACCAEIHRENTAGLRYEPLGPCLEGGLFSNFFGSGCLILRTETLSGNMPPLPTLLTAEGHWACLAKLALAGKQVDVIPDILIALQAEQSVLCHTELNYPGQMEIIQHYADGQPMWLRYFFTHVMASERRLAVLRRELEAKERKLEQMSDLSPARILFKIKRETNRIVKQCKGLFRGV